MGSKHELRKEARAAQELLVHRGSTGLSGVPADMHPAEVHTASYFSGRPSIAMICAFNFYFVR